MPEEHLHLTCLSCRQKNRFPKGRLDEAPYCARCGTPLADGHVAAIDLATLETAIETDHLPLLVDFWAPWCGPCRMMAPEFERLAKMLAPRVRLAKIDTQSHPDAAMRFGIRGIPAFILFHRGREVARYTGARPAAQLAQAVEEALAPVR